MDRDCMVRLTAFLLVAACCLLCQSRERTLHNGIVLPKAWPPGPVALSAEPPPTPDYLRNPPAVIPIDTGRQLFIDHFLIESTNLRRNFHRPEYYPLNPVLKAEKRWEFVENVGKAMVFSDGVFYDPKDNLFKIWYSGVDATLHATSHDGVHWEKPALDVRAGTNVVLPGARDASTVWLDLDEPDAAKRFKLLVARGHMKPFDLHYSADGIHWGEPVSKSAPWSDRSTFYRDPFLGKWVMSLRDHDGTMNDPSPAPDYLGRMRKFLAVDDLATGITQWNESIPWVGADRLDGRRIDINARPQLYQLDAFPYESVMVGLFTIWQGQFANREKPNQVSVGFTRDGFHWDRSWRGVFLGHDETPGAWNFSNVQSAGGGCLVVGDRLYFYASGRAGDPNIRTSGSTTTGLATLRRDGFASMDATGMQGTLTTRPVRYSGKHLFVNVDSLAGELLVELLDEKGNAIPGFTKADALPVRADNTLQQVEWKSGADISRFAKKPIRFRFHLREGSLYSFWVSPDESGASHGYVAAGGPGFTGSTDTVGKRSYATCCSPRVW